MQGPQQVSNSENPAAVPGEARIISTAKVQEDSTTGAVLEKFASENKVQFFLISFVDLLGVLRSKLVPASAIKKVADSGPGFAGYATHFRMTPADPDMIAIPDPTSVIQLPWKKEVAWVASDLYVNGQLLKQAPRQVLKEQIKKAADKGYRMKTGVECEFFLIRRDRAFASGIKAAEAYDTTPKPCYRQGSLMKQYDVISKLLEYMNEMGWKPYQADHEDGKCQFEINWEYDDCLATADKHVFFKFMVKTVAELYGLQASFMPKPFRNQTGNGCHCHVSLWTVDKPEERNLFLDTTEEMGLSGLAYQFLAGILLNAKALSVVYNPTVNSYKRLDGKNPSSGSSWAPPSYVSYTGNNRTHMVRIPDKGRFEVRRPDGAANPYLLQAALLASGLSGIEKELDCGPRCDWNAEERGPPEGMKFDALPENLLDALREFERSEYLKETLGTEFIRSYYHIQMEQWKSYSSFISTWELENTLDC
ncbi:hypothetical protein R1flu_006551 [Riccia fluitans]|uniref:Glutamine synthetase n=1 Tax=Riccia fluitans TaxID=41844 RepID=A0ABD1YWB3_9MARC